MQLQALMLWPLQDASSAGISLQEASVNTQELADHLLQGQRVIIALMNKAVLAEACESPERTAVWPSYTGMPLHLHDPCAVWLLISPGWLPAPACCILQLLIKPDSLLAPGDGQSSP